MVRGTSDIVTWFQNTNMPYWRIYPQKNIAGGNIVMQSRQEDGQSAGDALEDLKQKLRSINRGSFTMAAFPEPNKLPTKGYHYTDIEIPANEAQQAIIAGPVGLTQEDVNRQITAALTAHTEKLEKQQLEKKLAELEKENKELKKSVDEPWNKVIGALAPHAEKLIPGYFHHQAVAGLPAPDKQPVDNKIEEKPEETVNLNEEQQEAVSDFLAVLMESDPEWLDTLRRLAKKIKENPSMISMVKNFI
jgi:hypothetical protein